MSVDLCRWNETDFAVVDSSSLNLTYTIDRLGHLTRTIMPPESEWQRKKTYHLTQTETPLVAQVNALIGKYVENIRKIGQRFGLQIEGDGLECCRNFKSFIECSALERFEVIDLSNLDIDFLPFHIGLFKQVRRLDLSHNRLRVLPPDLLQLPCLQSINLRGNPIVELPSWITLVANLTIEQDDVTSDPDQMAQLPDNGI